MSNALYNAVTNNLDGPNYLVWVQTMQSYLMSQGQWQVITKSPPADADERKVWDDKDLQARGNIRLRLAQSIITAVQSKTTAKDVWDYLKTTYGSPGVPIVYKDFRAAMALSIPVLDKLDAYFQRLETNKFSVDEHVKVVL